MNFFMLYFLSNLLSSFILIASTNSMYGRLHNIFSYGIFHIIFSSGMESSYSAWEAEQERNKKAALAAA